MSKKQGQAGGLEPRAGAQQAYIHRRSRPWTLGATRRLSQHSAHAPRKGPSTFRSPWACNDSSSSMVDLFLPFFFFFFFGSVFFFELNAIGRNLGKANETVSLKDSEARTGLLKPSS